MNNGKTINQKVIYLFIGIISFIFLIGFFAGAYSYKKGQFSFYKQNVIDITSNFTKVIPNLLNNFNDVSIDSVYIETKDTDFWKIKSLRNIALNEGFISEEIKNFRINCEIKIGNINYPAKLSLTGTNLDHIVSKNKWSYRININNNDADNFNEIPNKFSLLVPYGRGNNLVSEWINLKLNNYLGNQSIGYNYKKVYLNKQYLGIFAFEEHFENILNRMPFGSFAFKIVDENTIKLYSKKNNIKDLLTHNAYFNNQWSKFLNKEIEVSALFNIQKIAMHYAISDLTNGHHTHHLSNNFFLYNNETKLIEPLAKEWESPYLNKIDFDLFINSHLKFSSKETQNFHNLFFRDDEFADKYLENLKKISNKNFIDAFLKDINKELVENKKILKSNYPHRTISENYLYKNLVNIKKSIDLLK